MLVLQASHRCPTERQHVRLPLIVFPIHHKHVYNVPEGSDAVMYQSMRALGFGLVLHLYNDEGTAYGIEFDRPRGAIVDNLVDLHGVCLWVRRRLPTLY
jgi:hypothetical protein